jgi:very-short-patch-repair endonuclease
MQQFFNRLDLKERRRELRNNPTHAEREMWCGLRKRRMSGYKFRRQHSIGPFIADFYSPALRLVVEVDGATHEDDEQKRYDARRTEYFRTHSIDEIRFTDSEVFASVDACMERIVKFIQERGRTTP